MKVDSVITLDNNINCLLLEKGILGNDNYFLSVILDENEEPSNEYVIFKEIIEGSDKYVEKVDDQSVLSELLKQFTIKFKDDVDRANMEDGAM